MLYVLLCGAFFIGSGVIWSNDVNTYRQFPTVAVNVIFSLLAFIFYLWMAVDRLVLLSYKNIAFLQRFHKYVVKMYNSPYGQLPDDCAVVCATIASCFYLLNFVLVDRCGANIPVKDGLNSACVSLDKPPPEAFVLTMVFIIILQITARGVSRFALVGCWFLTFVAINATLYLSHSTNGGFAWISMLLSCIMCVSYELERHSLSHFINTAKTIEACETASRLQLRQVATEVSIASDALVAKRALVSNVFIVILFLNDNCAY